MSKHAASERKPDFHELEAAFKHAAAALREAGIPFMLGGSLASWARGGPETRHDLDLMVRPEDADRALETLVQSGMTPERPPEEWLVKAWDRDILVDLIYHPAGMAITDEAIERAEELSVLGITVKVMALEDVLATKLLSMNDHQADFEPVLQIARALREQIDWQAVRQRTAGNPYAIAFLVLVEALGIAEGVSDERSLGAGNGSPAGVRPRASSAWAADRG